MVFASLEFLTLFLPAFLLVYALARPAWRNVILLIGSWLFYGWLSPLFLSLHVVLTIVAWVGGLLVDRAREGFERAGEAVDCADRVQHGGAVLVQVRQHPGRDLE